MDTFNSWKFLLDQRGEQQHDSFRKVKKETGQCDEILLDAILMRHHIIKDIMAYKEENGLNILDPEQEERQKEWLDGRLEDESNASEVWDIFHRSVKQVSRCRQESFSITISYLSDLWVLERQVFPNI